MKVFHYSMHNGCELDIKNFFADNYGFIVESFVPKNKPHEDYVMTSQKADKLWETYEQQFLNADIIVFSDTTPMSWCVLKNLYKLKSSQIIILWITNRFDYAIENNNEYYSLIDSAKNNKNVFFLYANKFEQYYLNNKVKICNNREYLFLPYGKRNKSDYKEYLKNHNNVPFVMSYQNETLFYPLIDELNLHNIPFYQKTSRTSDDVYGGPFEIQTCSAVIHIPYSWGTIAFSEYIAIGKPFILPSLSWLEQKYKTHKLWFQTNNNTKLIENYSLWYDKQHYNLFYYFDTIKDINSFLCDTDTLNKKQKMCIQQSDIIKKENIAIMDRILQNG